jgi:PAS domain S-box-containing protein
MTSTFWNTPEFQSCKLSEFLERSLKPICVYDDRGQTVYASQRFLKLLRISAMEGSFFECFPRNFVELKELWQRALLGESVQFVFQLKDAQSILECSLHFDADAKLMFSVLRQANAANRESYLDQAYEDAILKSAHSNLATALINSDGDVIRCNQHLHQLLGTSDRESINLEEYVHPDDRLTDEQSRQNLLNCSLNSYTIEKRFISRNNGIVWLRLTVSAIGLSNSSFDDSQHYFAVILEDVTENKKIYTTLVRTEEKWKTLLSNTPYLFIQTSSSGQITYVSPSVEELLGYQQEELLGQQFKELIHPSNLNELDLALQLWRSPIQTKLPALECWWRSKSNRWVALSIQGQLFPTELEIDGIVISGHNITDRKYLEVELKANEEKFRSLVANSLGAVFRCDSSYMIQFTSDRIRTITGYPASMFVNNQVRSYLSIVHPEDLAILKESLMQMILDRYPSSIEYRIINANGQVRWVAERKQGFFDQDGNLLWMDGLLLDVSDRKHVGA